MKLKHNQTPFHRESGELQFSYRPLRDLVFIFPDPPPEKLGEEGLIHIPEQWKKKYHGGVGVILAIGPGYKNDKGKFYPTPSGLKPGVRVFFDLTVPWGMQAEGLDGKKHYVAICGVADIAGIAIIGDKEKK